MAMQTTQFSTAARQVLDEVRRVVVGKDHILTWTLTTILAGGHILLEDIPGVGKTTMALSFCKALGLQCNRVQFTPDVLPSDVTGYSVPDQKTGELQYKAGAVLCNLFLADELNRATSRTQSALLEAMEEGQITVDGKTYRLPEPFIVMATQNPTGAAGTQLLPDSQMDRFTVRLSLGYPSERDEVAMVLSRAGGDPLQTVRRVLTREQLLDMQKTVAAVHVDESIVAYIVSIIAATRKSDELVRGASPRATLAVTAMAKALAAMRGRDYVVPEDVREVLPRTVAHRLLLSARAEGLGKSAEQVLGGIIEGIPSPRLR